MKHAVFVAAENAALPGAKVGGVGDVVRDLPVALVDASWRVTVLIPAYGFLHKLPGAKPKQRVSLSFGGKQETAQLYSVPNPANDVEFLLLEHRLLAPQGPGKVYCDDGPERPFATDAGKFAFFSAATAAWLTQLLAANQAPDVVHLHDWHAALFFPLRSFAPKYQSLKTLRCVYTIHNLAMQGIRPLSGDSSALNTWFPDLDYPAEQLVDPRYADCVNPMAAAIRLADRVNTVSPTYAREICEPDDPARGFHGGEGLHAETSAAQAQGRLTGILNGCFYPDDANSRSWRALSQMLIASQNGIDTFDLKQRLKPFRRRRPVNILTSIGRITSQKVELFLQKTNQGKTALDEILLGLEHDSLLIILGSGDPHLEQELLKTMNAYPHALMLHGYNEELAKQIYDSGDLFLMPSSFEPCGISQMLAMRSGQPCVVHGVGGLADTVTHDETGFVFSGSSVAEQATNFVSTVKHALTLRANSPADWRKICKAAEAERFSWQEAALSYSRDLYACEPNGTN
jgi:starch synthase